MFMKFKFFYCLYHKILVYRSNMEPEYMNMIQKVMKNSMSNKAPNPKNPWQQLGQQVFLEIYKAEKVCVVYKMILQKLKKKSTADINLATAIIRQLQRYAGN